MKTKKEKKKVTAMVAVAENKEREMTPSSLMALAITQNVSPEVIGKFMDLQDRFDEKKARRAFDEAMARFQETCPIIKKSKVVNNKPEKGGGERYKFAPLESIIVQVRTPLKNNGFSYTINAKVSGTLVEAIVRVKHAGGHNEESTFQVPIDPDSYMTQQQRFASALTFAKRYAFCNAFGIMTGDEDNDARGTEKPSVTGARVVKSDNEHYAMAEKLINSTSLQANLITIQGKIDKSPDFTEKEKQSLFKKINEKLEGKK